MSLQLVVVDWETARLFCQSWHRHLPKPPPGHLYRVAVAADDLLVGVGICGRPVAAAYQDGRTVEINRTVTDGYKNANSMLYGAAARVGFGLGYRRIITMTEATESAVPTHVRVRCRMSGETAPGQEAEMDARPLWLLDVDGVINAVTAPAPDGYRTLRADADGRTFTITYRPTLIERIARLAETVDIYWLTTRCEDAVTLGAALGLPTFTVCGTADHRASRGDGWWKALTAKRLSGDGTRPLIWTDDDLDYAEIRGEVDWLRTRTGPTLAISPDPRTGLSDTFMDRIEAFTAHSEPSRA